ncbi:MAG: serine O-acetyltransferase [Prevotella sp.]|nr:serine O-acetyltransferase [Alistipes senegalensis]MCM1357396.1 serine O-acetyltransferase [Prevotella sp.]MCM1472821.1 serine O-acetyltransferase [Muribaculaceae bacterium]
MFEYIKKDIRLIRERDPAVHSTLEILLTYPSITAVRSYRIAHWFYKRKMFTIARMISQHSRRKTGIEIHPGAEIGKGLFIDHGMGVVIGETAVIGDNCLLYQGVTLGGTGKDKGKRHPTLGHNVLVGAGAKVLGPFKVGNNVKIAANAVVLNEIPDNCTAVGVPARIVRRNGKKICRDVCSEIDQIHIPDPVSLEMCRLRTELERLKQEVSYMKK